MLRLVCGFTQFSFLINFNDGILSPPTPFKRWGHFNFEKLKSFGGSPYGEHSDNGKQRRGGGHNSGQNNCHTIVFFFFKKKRLL